MIGLWVCFAGTALGADAYPLLVEIDSKSYNNRSGGPIPLSMRVQCSLPDPGVSGDLVLELINLAGVKIGTYVLDGLFFTPGTQDYEFLIQPPTASLWEDQYDVFVTFRPTDGKSHRLNDQSLRVPGARRRACLITLAVDNDGPLPRNLNQLVSKFSLEEALPGQRDETAGGREVVTLRRSLDVQELPNHPLEHCVSDMLIVSDAMFAKLSRQQRQAILAWTRAGGSTMLVFDSGQRLNSDAIQLVNQLAGFPKESPGIYQTTDGTTYFENQSTDDPLLTKCGLGRTAVFALDESEIVDEVYSQRSLRRAFIHLWKIRQEQVRPVMLTGKWSWEPGRRYTAMYNWNFNNPNDPGVEQFIHRFRQSPALGGLSFLEQTRPTGMQMFPLWLISVTLLLYVAAIGPLDYFLLGALKLRKLTWGLFPIITLLFTWGAIFASNRMMQGSNEGGRVTFHDITDEGLIARENTVETMLLSSSRRVVLEAQGELITPIDISKLGASAQLSPQSSEAIPTSQPVYYGSFPTGARVVQSVHKWSPQIFRQMRIPSKPEVESSGFDWTVPVDPEDRNSRLALVERIRKAFGENVHAQFIRKNQDGQHNNSGVIDMESIVLCGQPGIFTASGETNFGVYSTTVTPYSPYAQANFRQADSVNFLYSSATREEHGMFSVVSRVSPKCDDFLEDLALLDSSDPDQWMLLIVLKKDNQWDVYRRVYSGD